MLQVSPIKTSVYSVDQCLEDFIISHIRNINLEGGVLAITSKIISIAEKRFVPQENFGKRDLVINESDHYLGEIGHGCHLTIKHGLMIPSAGIDESNSQNEDYILYPKFPFQSARRIHCFLKNRLNLNRFGVLLTDSHTTPLRKGVVGAALSYHGFSGVKDQINQPDLFGRKMLMTRINVADSLATAATLLMGETNECQPLALIKAPVDFTECHQEFEMTMPLEEDLYWPLIQPRLKE